MNLLECDKDWSDALVKRLSCDVVYFDFDKSHHYALCILPEERQRCDAVASIGSSLMPDDSPRPGVSRLAWPVLTVFEFFINNKRQNGGPTRGAATTDDEEQKSSNPNLKGRRRDNGKRSLVERWLCGGEHRISKGPQFVGFFDFEAFCDGYWETSLTLATSELFLDAFCWIDLFTFCDDD